MTPSFMTMVAPKMIAATIKFVGEYDQEYDMQLVTTDDMWKLVSERNNETCLT